MKKVFLVIFLTQFTTNACALNTLPLYKEEINEITRDPKTRQFKGSENDLSDLAGCQVDFELGRWVIDKVLSNINRDGEVWSRSVATISPNQIITKGESYIDYNKKNSHSSHVIKQLNFYTIYIGPWHFSPSIQKFIRFFAYYRKEGGDIKYQYESQTPENKLIPEKKFSLSKIAKIAPDRFGLCVVKWTAKYGYNSIAEVKYNGFFNKIFRLNPTPTGKIIEAKE
jgi:hypothetical protein